MSSVSRSSPVIELPPLVTRGGVAVGLAAAALLLGLFVAGDRWIAERMAGLDPTLHQFFQTITPLGRSPAYLVAAAAIGLGAFAWGRAQSRTPEQRGRARLVAGQAGFVFAAVAFAGIATDVIKPLVGRMRPSILFDTGEYGFVPLSLDSTLRSFPSGHATTAFALALALSALFPRQRLAWLTLGALVAASRFAINAHFFGDVVGGALVAAATVALVRRFLAARGLVFGVESGRYRRLEAPAPLRSPESR